MSPRTIQISVDRRVGRTVAAALGCTVERNGERWRLVTHYRDQAQLTGLLVQLGDLHLPYNSVAVTDGEPARSTS